VVGLAQVSAVGFREEESSLNFLELERTAYSKTAIEIVIMVIKEKMCMA
jgi:hypothetical protein